MLDNACPASDPEQMSLPFQQEKATTADFRTAREIAIDVVAGIFRDYPAEDDWNLVADNARPIVVINHHREHIPPTGIERRRVAPPATPSPAPARPSITGRSTETRKQPIAVRPGYSFGRNVALAVAGVCALALVIKETNLVRLAPAAFVVNNAQELNPDKPKVVAPGAP